MSLIAEADFSIKIRIIFKLLLSPIHEHTTLLVAKRLQSCVNFILCRPRSFRKVRHNDVTELTNA